MLIEMTVFLELCYAKCAIGLIDIIEETRALLYSNLKPSST